MGLHKKKCIEGDEIKIKILLYEMSMKLLNSDLNVAVWPLLISRLLNITLCTYASRIDMDWETFIVYVNNVYNDGKKAAINKWQRHNEPEGKDEKRGK